jgi:hypothetical protein
MNRRSIVRSLEWGAIAGGSFFLVSIMSLFLVFGDGTAPKLTEWMLGLNQFAVRILGLQRSESLLIIGATFWGCCVAVLVFVASSFFDRGDDNAA